MAAKLVPEGQPLPTSVSADLVQGSWKISAASEARLRFTKDLVTGERWFTSSKQLMRDIAASMGRPAMDTMKEAISHVLVNP